LNEGMAQGAYATQRDLCHPDAKVEPKRPQSGPKGGPEGEEGEGRGLLGPGKGAGFPAWGV